MTPLALLFRRRDYSTIVRAALSPIHSKTVSLGISKVFVWVFFFSYKNKTAKATKKCLRNDILHFM